MNCLIVSEQRRECSKCKALIRPGVLGLADDNPTCPEYLKKLDRRLAAAWAMIRAYGCLEALDQHIQPPQHPIRRR